MGIYYTKSNPLGVLSIDDKGNLIGFDTWHKINKKWVHIAQVFNKEKTIFYTNGKKEK
jgi:hypothetical protein